MALKTMTSALNFNMDLTNVGNLKLYNLKLKIEIRSELCTERHHFRNSRRPRSLETFNVYFTAQLLAQSPAL